MEKIYKQVERGALKKVKSEANDLVILLGVTTSDAWRDDFVDVLSVSDCRDSAGPEVWIQFSSAALTGAPPYRLLL